METNLSGEGATAIILYGVMHRSLKHVVASLRKYIISPLNRLGQVDIFFHSWDVGMVKIPRSGENGVEIDMSEVERWLPEARGIFESQEEFDRTIDWGPLFARNFMRIFMGNNDGSRASIMNYRRALESQERAWKYFQQTKNKSYSRVVVTRPDLLFLQDVPIPLGWVETEPAGDDGQKIPLTLYLPQFESCAGVCDSFAMGTEREIGIWCQRAAFADGWLLKAGDSNGETTEWLLSKWLQRNRVKMIFMDFIYMRVRANGELIVLQQESESEELVINARRVARLAMEEKRMKNPLTTVPPIAQQGDDAAVDGKRPSRIDYNNTVPAIESRNWYEDDLDAWKQCFTCEAAVRAMEIGVADEMSGKHLLGTLFPHPQSELHWVNTDGELQTAEQAFLNGMRDGGHEKQVQIYNGTSMEILAWMIAEEGFWESFDFIHHAGETPGELLADACQSWHLLKPGGVMIFNRTGGEHQLPKQLAVDAFVSAFGDRIQLMRDGKILVLKKL